MVSGDKFVCHRANQVLWANIDGTWTEVAEAHGIPLCSQIRDAGLREPIPEGFVGHTCSEVLANGDFLDVVYQP